MKFSHIIWAFGYNFRRMLKRICSSKQTKYCNRFLNVAYNFRGSRVIFSLSPSPARRNFLLPCAVTVDS